MRTKKYEMKGSGEKTRWGKVKKAAKSVSNATIFRGLQPFKKFDDPRDKKRWMISKIASEAILLPTVGRILRGTHLAARGIARKFAFTRSGKAQKEIRQTTGLADYNKTKKQADNLEEKRQKYEAEMKELADNATPRSNANTRGKWSKRFGRKLQTKSYFKQEGMNSTDVQGWFQRKFGKQTKSTQMAIKMKNLTNKQKYLEEKEKYILDKWKNKIAFQKKKALAGKRKGKTVFDGVLNGDLKGSLAAASKHVEDQKRIKRDKALQQAFDTKTKYNTAKKQFNDVETNFKTVRDKYYDALATAGRKGEAGIDQKIKDKYKQALVDYNLARSDKAIYYIDVPMTNAFGSPVLDNDGRQRTSQRQITYAKRQGYLRSLQKLYNKDQKNYQNVAGKPQTLNQLVERSKNSQSLKRGLSKLVPGPRPFGGLLSTYGTILKSATKAGKETKKRTRDKELIVKYWTKDKEGREQKLKEYIDTGVLNLGRNGKKLQKDPKNPNNPPQSVKLATIIEKNVEVPDPNNPRGTKIKQNIVDTMPYKEYLVHLSELKSKGKITSNEYEILQKYGKAKRINQIISDSAKKQTEVAITDKEKDLGVMKQRLGKSGKTYTYGTEIKTTELVTGFGNKKNDISNVKLLSLVDYETKEEKSKIESELKYINTIKDQKSKDEKIKELYGKYGATMPKDIKNINITDFNAAGITKYVIDTSTIFKDTDVKNALFGIFKEEMVTQTTIDPATKLSTSSQVPSGKIVLPTTTLADEIIKAKNIENKQFMTDYTKIDIPNKKEIVDLQTKAKTINTDDGKEFIASSIVKEALDDKLVKLGTVLSGNNPDEMNKLRDLDLIKPDNTLDPDKVLKHMLEEDKVMLNTELVRVDPTFNTTKYTNIKATNLDPDTIKKQTQDNMKSKLNTLAEDTKKKEEQLTALNLNAQTLEADPVFTAFKSGIELAKLGKVSAEEAKRTDALQKIGSLETKFLGSTGRAGTYADNTLEKFVQDLLAAKDTATFEQSQKSIGEFIKDPNNTGVAGQADELAKNQKLIDLQTLLDQKAIYDTATREKMKADPVTAANEKFTNLEAPITALQQNLQAQSSLPIKDKLKLDLINATSTPEEKTKAINEINAYILKNNTNTIDIKELNAFMDQISALDQAKNEKEDAQITANKNLITKFSAEPVSTTTPGAIPNADLVKNYNTKVILDADLVRNKQDSDLLIKDYLTTTNIPFTPNP